MGPCFIETASAPAVDRANKVIGALSGRFLIKIANFSIGDGYEEGALQTRRRGSFQFDGEQDLSSRHPD